MAIAFECSACKARYNIPDQQAGKKLRCPKCKAIVLAPAPAGAAAPASVARAAAPAKVAVARAPAAAAASQKICVVCHEDVSARKRIKDDAGDYHCESCWQQKQRQGARKTSKAVAAAGSLPPLPPVPVGIGVSAVYEAPIELTDDMTASAPLPVPQQDEGVYDLIEPTPPPTPARPAIAGGGSGGAGNYEMVTCASCGGMFHPGHVRPNAAGQAICTECSVTRPVAATKPVAALRAKAKAAGRGSDSDTSGGSGGGIGELLLGIVLGGGGIAATVIGYQAAASNPNGGRYRIWTGAIVWGAVHFFRGLVKMISG